MNTSINQSAIADTSFAVRLLLGFQHLLAVFGGIVTAPLILALAMKLPPVDTAYFISSSLVVSGVATFIQIQRIGIIGSGLLSIQGTSFTFIGPLIYCYFWLLESYPSEQALGMLFGSTAVCSVIAFCLSPFVRKISGVMTNNVTGTTVMLIGATLVYTTITNVIGLITNIESDQSVWPTVFMFLVPFTLIVVLSQSTILWLKMSSVAIGLCVAYGISAVLGWVDFSAIEGLPTLFIPEFNRYPLAINIYVIAILLPIFLVSLTESIGDLTVTSLLSKLSVGDKAYWIRVRGGLMADSLNSLLASLFATFPNTTFSQNNGVIRLTGVTSPHIGRFTACMLLMLGLCPVIAGLFQAMPQPVLYGATLIMFGMVAYAGWRIVVSGPIVSRDYWVVGIGVAGGYLLASAVGTFTWLPRSVQMTLQFPASTGAMVALVAELILPKHADAKNSGTKLMRS